MPNSYYNETFTASEGQQAKARSIESQFVAIERGFDLLHQQLINVAALNGMRFTGLADVPQSYKGAAYNTVRVSVGEGGLEFVPEGRTNIKFLAVTNYTLLSEDANYVVAINHANPITATVNAGVFGVGDIVILEQYGAGKITLAAGAGVTINSSDNLLTTRRQFAAVGLVCLDAGGTTFSLVGERDAGEIVGNYAFRSGGNAFTGVQAVGFVNLVDGATINTDASLSNNFRVTLGGNRALANPTNLLDGAVLNFWIRQDATGSRTLSFGAKFKWGGGTAPTLTTAANALDFVCCQYYAAMDILVCAITKDVR